jgi:hypothetical protein
MPYATVWTSRLRSGNSVWHHALHTPRNTPYVPLDRLPARFRAGRSGCRGALFLLHYGFLWPAVTLLLTPHVARRTLVAKPGPPPTPTVPPRSAFKLPVFGLFFFFLRRGGRGGGGGRGLVSLCWSCLLRFLASAHWLLDACRSRRQPVDSATAAAAAAVLG